MQRIVCWLLALAVMSLTTVLAYAVQWPVWPHNNDADQHRVVQDYGCVGLASNLEDPSSEIGDDFCFSVTKSHAGIDIGCETSGCPYTTNNEKIWVKPVTAGTVLCSKNDCADDGSDKSCNHGYGNAVAVQCGPACVDMYGHMKKGSVSAVKGSFLTETSVLGYIGISGQASGPHLHYERRYENPANAAICKSDPMAVAGYVSGHPSNYHIEDPWTLLTTPTRKLLFVSVPEANIYRGPGTKYSVFGQASKNQIYVDVTEEDYVGKASSLGGRTAKYST